MQDEALARFALAVAPVAAAILAITGALLIYLLDQRHRDEPDAFRRARSSAISLVEFLTTQSENPHNYVANPPDIPFGVLVSRIASAHSGQSIPTYISWRTETAAIIAKSQEIGAQIESLTQQAIEGGPVTGINPDLFELHRYFGLRMQPLDEAIQDLDWLVGLRRVGTKEAVSGAIIAAILLVASLVIGLASLVEIGGGVPDQLNFVGGGFLVSLTVLMCVTLYRSYQTNTKSREELITERVAEKTKELTALADSPGSSGAPSQPPETQEPRERRMANLAVRKLLSRPKVTLVAELHLGAPSANAGHGMPSIQMPAPTSLLFYQLGCHLRLRFERIAMTTPTTKPRCT